ARARIGRQVVRRMRRRATACRRYPAAPRRPGAYRAKLDQLRRGPPSPSAPFAKLGVIPRAPQHEVKRCGHGTYFSIEKVVGPGSAMHHFMLLGPDLIRAIASGMTALELSAKVSHAGEGGAPPLQRKRAAGRRPSGR